MQLKSTENIPNIVKKSGFAIFEIPEGDFAEILPNCYHARFEKTAFSKEELDSIAHMTQNKQTEDFIMVLENAEHMTPSAANTFLKTLEQPGENVHFVFLVRSAANILPTIKSRAHNYFVPSFSKISAAPDFAPEIMALAKKYIAATPQQLPKLATEIAGKDSKKARERAAQVIDAAIQILYKSYFMTGNSSFLKKLDNLLAINAALDANGHLKLQLVANML